jgi:hypothetical protein
MRVQCACAPQLSLFLLNRGATVKISCVLGPLHLETHCAPTAKQFGEERQYGSSNRRTAPLQVNRRSHLAKHTHENSTNCGILTITCNTRTFQSTF